MAGYHHIRRREEPFQAWCHEHLPTPEPALWQALTERRPDRPENLRAYLRETFGGAERRRRERESFRSYARLMATPTTPTGYAWSPYVGAHCAVCGREV
ncbi:MAG: hypothetical protein KatS3mg015_2844 [Fimbriimonadales bacterium]|nr:MAG: hypothetical protein KatS3mg015_2844 [Fimbriimonadales bacterium]